MASTPSIICKVDECSNSSKARGLCNMHWYRWYRTGDPVKTVKNYEIHGLTKALAYSSWKALKQRTLNPRAPYYEYYGGRGITVCDGVKNSFKIFIDAVGERPTLRMTIDRIDNDSGYFCGSCDDCKAHDRTLNMRWATKSEQQHNSRRYEVMA